MKNLWNKIKPSRRKIMQLYFALLFNCNIQGFFTGKIYANKDHATSTKQFCAPGINCYSCPGAVGACPLGSLQGSFSADRSTLFYVCGTLLLYAILFGRMICGWLCPFGLIQELLYKIKSPKVKKSPVTRILSFFKYAILVFFVGIVPIAYALRSTPMPTFCKYICPAGTIEGGLLLLANKANESVFFPMLKYLFTWKFILMISIVVGSVFIFRLFCRFLCPLGALYGLFNKLSIFGVKVDESKCTHCNLCIAHCKCDIKHVGDQECIYCGECIDVCPTKAISWKGSKIFLKANEIPADLDAEAVAAAKQKQTRNRTITRIVCGAVMLAVLIGAIGYYWNPEVDIFAKPTEVTVPTGPDRVVGNLVGNLCPSIDLAIVTKDAVTEETIDPTTTGKITIINFWGTWCAACVAELPYFDQIASEYADQVEVIAIHTSGRLPTAPAYIAANYPNSKITFAADSSDSSSDYDVFYEILGGAESGGAYPFTVILDAEGVITFKVIGSVHYEDLQREVEKLING